MTRAIPLIAVIAVLTITGCASSSSTEPAPTPEAAPVTVPFSVVQAKFTGRAQRIATSETRGTTVVTVRSSTLEQTGETTAIGIVAFHVQDVQFPEIQMDDTTVFDVTFNPENGNLTSIVPQGKGAADTSAAPNGSAS